MIDSGQGSQRELDKPAEAEPPSPGGHRAQRGGDQGSPQSWR